MEIYHNTYKNTEIFCSNSTGAKQSSLKTYSKIESTLDTLVLVIRILILLSIWKSVSVGGLPPIFVLITLVYQFIAIPTLECLGISLMLGLLSSIYLLRVESASSFVSISVYLGEILTSLRFLQITVAKAFSEVDPFHMREASLHVEILNNNVRVFRRGIKHPYHYLLSYMYIPDIRDIVYDYEYCVLYLFGTTRRKAVNIAPWKKKLYCLESSVNYIAIPYVIHDMNALVDCVKNRCYRAVRHMSHKDTVHIIRSRNKVELDWLFFY